MLASIGVLDRRERLLAMLEEVAARFKKTGRVQISPRREGPEEYLDVTADLRAPQAAEFRQAIANAVGAHIVTDLEPILLKRICERTFRPVMEEERQAILSLAGRTLERDPKESRRELVARRIAEYLKGEARLNLRGFITFRLKDYVDDLEEAVDRAVDDFLVEREYAEFIRLLRYFVEAQTPHMEKVHVTVSRDGSFRIFDGGLAPLDGGDLKEFVFETVDTEVAYEDFLVSALISLAPAEIVIHDPAKRGDPSSITTVERVFCERLKHCGGCSLCDLREHVRKR